MNLYGMPSLSNSAASLQAVSLVLEPPPPGAGAATGTGTPPPEAMEGVVGPGLLSLTATVEMGPASVLVPPPAAMLGAAALGAAAGPGAGAVGPSDAMQGVVTEAASVGAGAGAPHALSLKPNDPRRRAVVAGQPQGAKGSRAVQVPGHGDAAGPGAAAAGAAAGGKVSLQPEDPRKRRRLQEPPAAAAAPAATAGAAGPQEGAGGKGSGGGSRAPIALSNMDMWSMDSLTMDAPDVDMGPAAGPGPGSAVEGAAPAVQTGPSQFVGVLGLGQGGQVVAPGLGAPVQGQSLPPPPHMPLQQQQLQLQPPVLVVSAQHPAGAPPSVAGSSSLPLPPPPPMGVSGPSGAPQAPPAPLHLLPSTRPQHRLPQARWGLPRLGWPALRRC